LRMCQILSVCFGTTRSGAGLLKGVG
ncbi:hypothetical protein AVEN_167761-1, partial [Araneus ventricosus]